MRRFLLICCGLAPAIALGSSALAAPLYANDFAGNIYDINLTTGAATNARKATSALIGIAGLGDSLYSVQITLGPDYLIRIDPATGAATQVGEITGISNPYEGDLAFDPITTGLFAVNDANALGERLLYTIGPDGASTQIGPIATGGDHSAMAFDAAGHLFVLDTAAGGKLIRVDPTNANQISSVPLSIPLGDTAGMAIDPDTGIAYVADGNVRGTNNLYTINLNTGQLMLVGSTGLANGLAGLTFFLPDTATPGDTDGDGDVDDSDLGTAFANYTGQVANGGKTSAQGDTDGDGDVDDSDLGTSFANYTGPQTPTSVPEPASLVMLGLAGLVLPRRCR